MLWRGQCQHRARRQESRIVPGFIPGNRKVPGAGTDDLKKDIVVPDIRGKHGQGMPSREGRSRIEPLPSPHRLESRLPFTETDRPAISCQLRDARCRFGGCRRRLA